MIKEFEGVSASEVNCLVAARLLVCILVAGADNKIDRKEIKRALELANRKGENVRSDLKNFYQAVAADFEDKLKFLLQSLPTHASERTPLIVIELGKLNGILAGIKDKFFCQGFYDSLRYIAREIAESSGGVLFLNKVGEEEEGLVRLPMIKDPSAV